MKPASTAKSKVSALSTNPKANSISTQVTCKLCSKFFIDPRLLPCLHSFCFKCLTSKTNICPTCKKSFKFPKGGLAALPKDLRKQYEVEVAEYVVKIESSSDISCDRCLDSIDSNTTTFCCDCSKFLCSRCTVDHTRHREMHQHKLVDLGKDQVDTQSLLDSIPHKTASCQVHSDEALKFYCETCQQLVCRDCIILEHNNHKYNRVEQVAEKEKQDLKFRLSEVTLAADQLQTSSLEVVKMITRVKKRKESVDELIKSEFKKLHEAITAREKTLLAKNREINFEKETALKIQQESMTSLKVDIQQFTQRISEALDCYHPVELLSARTAMATGLTNFNTQFGSLQLNTCKSDGLCTSFSTITLLNDIEKYGVVTAGCYVRNSTVSLYSSELIQGERKSLNITARNADGKPHKHGGENVVAYLSPLDSEKTSTFTAEDNNDGTYSVTITPQSIGEHSLDIKIGSESIQSSPFIVYVLSKRNYNNLRPVLNIDVSNNAYNVTVSGNKLFIVSNGPGIIVANKDSGALLAPISCLSEVYDNNYEEENFIYDGSCDIAAREFRHCAAPIIAQLLGIDQLYGIAAQDNFLYIGHQRNCCIYKLTTGGKYMATIGSPGSGNGQLQTPTGLCISTDGELFVVESSGDRVSVFKTDGTFIRHIQGHMNGPWDIAIDPAGNIHISNYISNNITVYTHEGQFVRQYGNGQLTCPIGLTITADGFSVVADYQSQQRTQNQYQQSRCNTFGSYLYCSRVLIFNTTNFNLVSTIQGICTSYGVASDRDGYIYVCDNENMRIVKY